MGRQRVARVRGDRRRRHDREQLVHQRRRVARERGPCPDAFEPELRSPLAERDEEREQEGAEQEPVGDGDVHRDRACGGAKDEEAGDREHVDELQRLQAERVRGLQCPEADHARDGRRAQSRRERQGEHRERGGQRERVPDPELPARDRAEALDRVQPVRFDVADVVDEVRGARGRAVRDERGEGGAPAAGVAELRREHDPREQQEVLRPLPRPQRDECRDRGRPPSGELEDRRLSRLAHGETLWRAWRARSR